MKKHSRPYTITVLSALLAIVLTACGASQPDSYTVGVFNPLAFGPPSESGTFQHFKDGLATAGYTEGENLTFIHAEVGGFAPADMEAAAQQLVEADVDLILCMITSACIASKNATAENDTPVVFIAVTDPVDAGLVGDWTNPGGNVTGVASAAKDIANEGRRLQWLIQMAPNTNVVFVPYNPNDPVSLAKLAAVQTAANELGLDLSLAEVTSPDQAAAAFSTIPDNADAVMLFSEQIYTSESLDVLFTVALERQLPTTAIALETGVGNLMYYSSNLNESAGQVARLAAQILDGGDPATLPVEAPEFFLTVNQATAEAIGLSIPADVLQAADEIIRE